MYTSESCFTSNHRAVTGSGFRGSFRAVRLGHDAHQPPVLVLRQRPGLHDLDRIANPRLIRLVVCVADRTALDVLTVTSVLDQPRNLDAAGLVHLVARHNADQYSPLAPSCRSRRGRVSHWRPPSSRPSSFFLSSRSGPGQCLAWPCESRSAFRAYPLPTGTEGGTSSFPVPSNRFATARRSRRDTRRAFLFASLAYLTRMRQSALLRKASGSRLTLYTRPSCHESALERHLVRHA